MNDRFPVLDLNTLMVGGSLLFVTVTVVFTLTTTLRHNDVTNRLWNSSLIAITTSFIFLSIWTPGGSTPPATTAAADATWLYALGVLWAGARVLNERKPMVWMAIAAAIATAVIALLNSVAGEHAYERLITYCLVATFAWLSGAELRAGPMGGNLNARILWVSLGLYGLVFIAVAASVAAAGGLSQQLTDGFDSGPSVLLTAGLFIIVALCISGLRAERRGNYWSGDDSFHKLQDELGSFRNTGFEEAARDRLARMSYSGGNATLLITELNDLPELNTAFGRTVGDDALINFTRILRNQVPVSALIGHLRGGCFAIMLISSSPKHAEEVAMAIETGMINATARPAPPVRLGVSFGSADTWTVAANYDQLMAAARDDLPTQTS